MDIQQLQQSGSQRWGLRDDRPVVAAGRDAPQTGQGLEDQPAVRVWPAGRHTAVEGDSGSDGAPDLPLNQAEGEQGKAAHGDQGLDAPVGLHEQGRERQRALEGAVAVFDDLLVL